MTKRPPTINGIKTLYRGIQMRSRTEAKWAAMFDELGWGWQYEPEDLAGYIPDFILRFDEAPLLVEVKSDAHTIEALAEYARKVELAGWNHEAMIVASGVWNARDAQPIVGWFGERVPRGEDLEWLWGEARLFRCLSCGKISVLSGAGNWRCRICGEGEGNEHVGALEGIEKLWANATNAVQWPGVGK